MKSAKSARVQLPEQEWNFDSVPDSELLACCYWEYARESVSICNAVEKAKAAQAKPKVQKRESKARAEKRMAANRAVGLLMRTGFDTSFWLGLPFPSPWQSLDKSKRAEWAQVCPTLPTPEKIPPFRATNDIFIAAALHEEAMTIHKTREALCERLSAIDRGVAGLMEAAEIRKRLADQEMNRPPLLITGLGNVSSFIGQINWDEFSNKEILASFEAWVKAKGNRPDELPNRPKGVRGLRGERGHDPQNWRASVARLGIMRLVNRHPFEEITEITQAGASAKTADREKYSVKAECKKERARALKDFRALFRFLPAKEMPRSWEPLPDCW